MTASPSPAAIAPIPLAADQAAPGASIGRSAPGADSFLAVANPRRAGRIAYPLVRSLVTKRSVVIGRHKTSISLEDGFWTELRRFARADGLRLTDIVGDIDAGLRNKANLSSAIRLFIVDRLKGEIAELLAGVAGALEPAR